MLSTKPVRKFFIKELKIFNEIRRQSSSNRENELPNGALTFFMKLLDASFTQSKNILKENPRLTGFSKSDIKKSFDSLRKLDYSVDAIRDRPALLCLSPSTLENRHTILDESGCNVSSAVLARYMTIVGREIANLKAHGVIPYDVNVQEKLCSHFQEYDIRLDKKYDEKDNIKNLRQIVLSLYLVERLDVKKKDLEKIWKTYVRLKNKSYSSVKKMIDILMNDLNFPKDRIVKNAYLLYGDPSNISRIMHEIKTIGGEDIREIIYRRPKISMSSCDSILKTIDHVRSFGIPEISIVKCLEILTLGPDTVYERLKELEKISEFKVLFNNPRVLRLVHYQNKALIRLDYLNQIKIKCASLHILSTTSESFEKYVREGDDKTKGRDVIIFLKTKLNKTDVDIRNLLSRHPNWCYIPLLSIQNCYDFLIMKKFTPEDIYRNIHILLYPTDRIDDKLIYLQKNESYEDLKLETNYLHVTSSQLLGLIVYLIEVEFHFSADGIWMNAPAYQLENFNQVLPDFPDTLSKEYKYGVKPSAYKMNQSLV